MGISGKILTVGESGNAYVSIHCTIFFNLTSVIEIFQNEKPKKNKIKYLFYLKIPLK